MPRKKVIFTQIGVIRTPFKKIAGTPIQAVAAKHKRGVINIYPEYKDGLKDLNGFSHIILLYHFHKVRTCSLLVKPFLDTHRRGVFATRAPVRPNPIGMSVVRLKGIKGTEITVEDIDVVDKTPLLDIKPYVPTFDRRQARSIGWLAKKKHRAARTCADDRFR